MNKKLIALAVASVVAAPAAYSADVSVYGRINNAITAHKTGGTNNTDVSSIGSRFGIKASSELGNGLTATGKYEFSTTTDKEQPNIGDLRIGTVGLSGGFGSVTIGNQWSAYFDTVGTDLDAAYTLGYHLFSAAGGAYRASNTIKYSNSFGPVYLEVDLRQNESGEDAVLAEALRGDGWGAGVRVSPTDAFTFALAMDNEQRTGGDIDRRGASVRLGVGNFYGMLGYQTSEIGSGNAESQLQLWLGANVGSTRIQLGLGEADLNHPDTNTDASRDASQIVLGVYHSLGGGMKLYYEGTDVDDLASSNSSYAEGTTHIFGMRYDF